MNIKRFFLLGGFMVLALWWGLSEGYEFFSYFVRGKLDNPLSLHSLKE